jgi:hypothetical protein
MLYQPHLFKRAKVTIKHDVRIHAAVDGENGQAVILTKGRNRVHARDGGEIRAVIDWRLDHRSERSTTPKLGGMQERQ